MHGRVKSSQTRSETELKAIQKKADSLSTTVLALLASKKREDFSDDALDLTTKILLSNPDFYSVWNYRREILCSRLPELSTFSHEQRRIVNNDLRDRDLKLSEDCIRKNPKSYGSWHHRQWILERLQTDYASELELCKLFLLEDQRNFHCWCYRRYVVQTGGIESQEEFDFSTEKINENFSNYSAYHHRSVYIRKTGKLARDIVEAEFSMIENAIYTEPDDQSSWWYHQFLLTWMCEQKDHDGSANHEGNNKDDGIKWYISIVEKQIEVMRGLLSVETSSKWAMSSLCLMLDILLKLSNADPTSSDAGSCHHFTVTDLVNEQQALLSKLCLVDPHHANRYNYMKRR